MYLTSYLICMHNYLQPHSSIDVSNVMHMHASYLHNISELIH